MCLLLNNVVLISINYSLIDRSELGLIRWVYINAGFHGCMAKGVPSNHWASQAFDS